MEADERQGRKMPRSYIHEERYVLVIDGQRKASFGGSQQNTSAYPRVTIVVHDQQEDTVAALLETPPTAKPAPRPD